MPNEREPTWSEIGVIAQAVAVLINRADLSHDLLAELAGPLLRRLATMGERIMSDPHGDSDGDAREVHLCTPTDVGWWWIRVYCETWTQGKPGRVVRWSVVQVYRLCDELCAMVDGQAHTVLSVATERWGPRIAEPASDPEDRPDPWAPCGD